MQSLPRKAAELAAFQRSFQSVLTSVDSTETALGQCEIDLAAELLPSSALSGEERINIYRDMYQMRLLEVLQNDFPVLSTVIGEDGFAALARSYIARHPSHDFTLALFGQHFADFMRTSTAQQGYRAWWPELAQLEWARVRVEEAETALPLSAADIARVPFQHWQHVILRPVAALRLLSCRYGVDKLINAHDEGRPIGAPCHCSTHVVVFRRDGEVLIERLAADIYQLLLALVSGNSLGDALQHAIESGHAAAVKQVGCSMQRFFAAGFFSTIEIQSLSTNSKEIAP